MSGENTLMCRVCMEIQKPNNYFWIFSDEISPGGKLICDALMYCASVSVCADDGLPDKICHDCTSMLRLSCLLKEKVQSADVRLRQMFLDLDETDSEEITCVEEDEETVLKTEDEVSRVEVDVEFHEKDSGTWSLENSWNDGAKELLNSVTPSQRSNLICKLCKKAFTSDTEFKKHCFFWNRQCAKGSHMKLPFCRYCGDTFQSKWRYLRHAEHAHNYDSKIFKKARFRCKICNKGFPTKITFEIHEQTHGPFLCDICGIERESKKLLWSHKKRCGGVKNVFCNICERGFTRKGLLAQHMVTHFRETPFMCSYCSKTFNRQWNLTQHERMHTGVLPYTCDVCGQSFRHNVTMKQHRTRHLNPIS